MNIWKKHGIISGMKPANGGWKFPQRMADGTNQWLSADSADKLLEKVQIVRIENAMPIGDPARDIAEYIRVHSPANDAFRYGRPQGAPQVTHVREIVSLIERMKIWLVGTAKRSVTLVREDDALSRGNICAQCPQNIRWETSCDSCNSDIVYRSNNLRQRPKFSLDKKLRGCRLHGFPCQSAIFIDRDNLPPRHEKAPDACWIGKTQ
jgi:hypothetical protein